MAGAYVVVALISWNLMIMYLFIERGANLRNNDLSAIILVEADLRMANLSFPDLRDADLHNANLQGAKLTGAKCANLLNTILIKAEYSEDDLISDRR